MQKMPKIQQQYEIYLFSFMEHLFSGDCWNSTVLTTYIQTYSLILLLSVGTARFKGM